MKLSLDPCAMKISSITPEAKAGTFVYAGGGLSVVADDSDPIQKALLCLSADDREVARLTPFRESIYGIEIKLSKLRLCFDAPLVRVTDIHQLRRANPGPLVVDDHGSHILCAQGDSKVLVSLIDWEIRRGLYRETTHATIGWRLIAIDGEQSTELFRLER
jgi:hypothetical protein